MAWSERYTVDPIPSPDGTINQWKVYDILKGEYVCSYTDKNLAVWKCEFMNISVENTKPVEDNKDQKTMEEKERYRVEFDPNDNKWKLYDTRNFKIVETYMSKSIAENVCSYRNDRHREADITNDKNTRCIFSKGNVKIYKYGFFLIIVHIENGNITFHCPYASVGDPSVATRKKMEKAFAEKFFECANPPTNP